MSTVIAYQDPVDRGPLVAETGGWINSRSGARYPIRDGMPSFGDAAAVAGPNALYQRMYDRFAPFYNAATSLYARFRRGADRERRMTYLGALELKPGDHLLEVSVGTGSNWAALGGDYHYYGLDLSSGMLTCCRRRVRRMGLHFELCQGLAERLPYPDCAFDCVFHAGGINFFTDPQAALREMVRVAKPGTRLMVADETEALARRYENQWIGGAFFKNRPRAITTPVALLPPGMLEIDAREICDGDLYVLSFRKPR